MQRLFSTCALALASTLFIAGCASGPDVRTSVDSSADFSRYKTFSFVHPLGTDRAGYQSIVSNSLKQATKRELEARGLREDSSDPQLLINFNAKLTDKMRVDTMPAPMMGMGYYGYRGGMYGAWPMYQDQTVVTPYKEGTLNIDVVDRARRQMVWEGVVTDSVSDKEMAQMEQSINVAITAAFAKFPVPAPKPAASAPAKAP